MLMQTRAARALSTHQRTYPDGHGNSIDDLVRLVEVTIDGPIDLVAQSMGGVIAARIALNRSTVVRRLVLAVTSAGVNMTQFGAPDWRADYRRQFPQDRFRQHDCTPTSDVPHLALNRGLPDS
jgi:pimeloyl-ACP methyl ester carboxylesterase